MNFQIFKIFEIVSGFYYLIVSHINDPDLNLTIAENWGATDESNPINQFISLTCGWDHLQIEKSDIACIDVITKNIPQDIKCMNNSDEYKKLTEEILLNVKPKKEKIIKEPKQKIIKEPKQKKEKIIKEPKPKAKKSNEKIDLEKTMVNIIS